MGVLLDSKEHRCVSLVIVVTEVPMLDVILVAANLWLCPGDVYTDRQATGCKEVKESNEKEGFSRSQEAPEFGSSSNAASGQATCWPPHSS